MQERDAVLLLSCATLANSQAFSQNACEFVLHMQGAAAKREVNRASTLHAHKDAKETVADARRL
jgi:hypothetical protein